MPSTDDHNNFSGDLLISYELASRKLKNSIAEGNIFFSLFNLSPIDNNKLTTHSRIKTWHTFNIRMLGQIYGNGSYIDEYNNAFIRSNTNKTDLHGMGSEDRNDVEAHLAYLNSALKELETYYESPMPEIVQPLIDKDISRKVTAIANLSELHAERWREIRRLGEGGQGITYLVKDEKNHGEKLYVLKLLKDKENIKPGQRLSTEIQAIQSLQSLQHPNIVRLIDFGSDQDKPYYVTEYYQSGDLTKLIDPNQELNTGFYVSRLNLFIQVCEGLYAAHEKGIIHRDIKPENILLRSSNGPAVIADFGICYVDTEDRLTSMDEKVGPRYYIAPELEDGKLENITAQSDVYSLGKLLYWLMSNGKIFSREKHRDPRYDLVILTNNPKMEHVNRSLDRMIRAKPEDRYKSARDVLADVRTLRRIIHDGYNAVSRTLTQICTYCGLGNYSPHETSNEYGLLLICGQCGHNQRFSIDTATRKDWWAIK